jgi:hypothetical protein
MGIKMLSALKIPWEGIKYDILSKVKLSQRILRNLV